MLLVKWVGLICNFFFIKFCVCLIKDFLFLFVGVINLIGFDILVFGYLVKVVI